MKFKIESDVFVCGIRMKHKHIQEFADDSNVFGRVLEYHKYMNRTFPKCDYKLIKAKEI